ncbi:importin subunit beta-1-like [Prunus yedoensis var. nudiflora]|uniref:Importin subunit beta-1-like n=1 Tax=Prunus yedoensis var. nudiflora TaxID=2094558 RepID=A0A314Z1V4_PRUYE|nr:importin subunit beta-1-like [Prunus yedoensis var. nudiflora]
MMPHFQYILQFIQFVLRETHRDDSVTNAAVTALGDVADVVGPNFCRLWTMHNNSGQRQLALSKRISASWSHEKWLVLLLVNDIFCIVLVQLRTTAACTLERIKRIMESREVAGFFVSK